MQTSRHSSGEGSEPLTEEERRKLRELLDRDEKARWLAASVRAWGAWAAAILIGFVAFKDSFVKLLKDLVQ